jgi:Hydantoinase B/oxoprolinase
MGLLVQPALISAECIAPLCMRYANRVACNCLVVQANVRRNFLHHVLLLLLGITMEEEMGSDGRAPIDMQLEFLRPITASMLSERRSKQPFGLQGGGPGASGLNLIVRRDGRRVNMGGKATALLQVAVCCFRCSMLGIFDSSLPQQVCMRAHLVHTRIEPEAVPRQSCEWVWCA